MLFSKRIKKNFFLFQETQVTSPRNNLNQYYESLRNNVITLLEQARHPNSNQPAPVEKSSEHFDNYLSKLQDFTVLPTPI